MGFRFRKSFKIGPARMTFSKSGVSKSIGVKGLRVTRTAKGKTKTTVSIPGGSISHTSGSSGRKRQPSTSPPRRVAASSARSASASLNTGNAESKRQSAKRTPNPPKPQRSPKIYRACGIIMILLGVIGFLVFWWLGLIIFGIGLYYLVCGQKIYDKLLENYNAAHPKLGEKHTGFSK